MSKGFTLIEVLVALAIVAVALLAGLQASSTLTRNAHRQADVLLGHLCAENQLVALRLAPVMPPIGTSQITCEQAGRAFAVRQSVQPTPNPSFLRIDATALDEQGNSVVNLSTVMGRF
jgi:general secretion pathway protein I